MMQLPLIIECMGVGITVGAEVAVAPWCLQGATSIDTSIINCT